MKTFCSEDGFCIYRDCFGNCVLPCPLPEEIKTDKQDITFQQVLNLFREALREDEGLYIKYQSEIAMTFIDTARRLYPMYTTDGRFNQLFEVADAAAKNFLDSLIKEEEKK